MSAYKTKAKRDHEQRETNTRVLLVIFGNWVLSKQKSLLPFKIFGYSLVKVKQIDVDAVDAFEKYLETGKK